MRNNSFKILSLAILSSTLFFCRISDDKQAGGGTETGNVVGVILDEGEKAPGTKVSLFEKVSVLDSPKVVFKPFKETETDKEGKFSFDVAEGSYTVVATDGEKYAFIDDIAAGTETALDLEGRLLPPGGLKGKIKNTLELSTTSAIVAHLIGTRIYANVDEDGDFEIAEIPAGTYTLVTYSTFQPEFSPSYRTVTIRPDSITDLGEFELTYNGIPIPKNIRLAYDTALGVVTMRWDSIASYPDFQEYVVMRGLGNQPVRDLQQIGYTRETFFADTVTFDSTPSMVLEYRVFVVNKLGDAGKFYGTYDIKVVTAESQIPAVAGFTAAYDTLRGTVKLGWDPVEDFANFGGYLLLRNLYNPDITVGGGTWDTVALLQTPGYADTIYPVLVPLENLDPTTLTYHIRVLHKDWNVFGGPLQGGMPFPTLRVHSYRRFQPVISAGADTTVDLGQEVVLKAAILQKAFPISKIEWKIKDSSWIQTESGEFSFRVNEDYRRESFPCSLRVTDAAGNVSMDHRVVTKTPLITTYDALPTLNATSTEILKAGGKYWTFSSNPNFVPVVLSSPDFRNWTVEPYVNGEDLIPLHLGAKRLVAINDKLLLFCGHKDKTWPLVLFSSQDGKLWEKVAHNLTATATGGHGGRWSDAVGSLLVGNNLFLSTNSIDTTIYTSSDAVNWTPFSNTLAWQMFSLGDSVCYDGSDRNCTQEAGANWVPSPLWESQTDYAFNRDWMSVIASEKGKSVLRVTEIPNNKSKILYGNGKDWIDVPIDLSGYARASMVDGRLFFFRDSRWHSFALPK